MLWALAELALDASFEKAAARLGRLAGVVATAKRAERAAKQVGREITAWDEAEPALGEAPAETMCRGPDGTGVPVARRDAGTAEDGRPSKTREAKVAVFHTAERRNPKTGLPERDAGSARRTAAIDSAASRDVDAEPSAFARRLWRAAERFGFAAAKRQVVVADGAKWIWNAAAELFPNAVRVVDIRHARERLREVGRAVYGAGTELCRATASAMLLRVALSGGVAGADAAGVLAEGGVAAVVVAVLDLPVAAVPRQQAVGAGAPGVHGRDAVGGLGGGGAGLDDGPLADHAERYRDAPAVRRHADGPAKGHGRVETRSIAARDLLPGTPSPSCACALGHAGSRASPRTGRAARPVPFPRGAPASPSTTTPRYHRAFEEALAGAGLPLARANPLRARRFAESMGRNAKTDAVDAAVLARMGAALELWPTEPPGGALRDLGDLTVAREALVRDRVAALNRQKGLRLALLRRRLKAVDAEIARTLAGDEGLARRAETLASIPGVGKVTAAGLLAAMPELGGLDAKAAASLAGLAPVARESGQWQGKRFIQGGRARARRLLHMAAVAATRHNPDLDRKYRDLIGRGKPPKVALVAVMRKLLLLANALLRQNRLWTPRAGDEPAAAPPAEAANRHTAPATRFQPRLDTPAPENGSASQPQEVYARTELNRHLQHGYLSCEPRCSCIRSGRRGKTVADQSSPAALCGQAWNGPTTACPVAPRRAPQGGTLPKVHGGI